MKNKLLLFLNVLLVFLLFFNPIQAKKIQTAVIISANAEWRIIKQIFPTENYQKSPYGEYFFKQITVNQKQQEVLFFHEGWGKIAAAGATQYVIDQFKPKNLINLGTCGGYKGQIERFEIVLAEKTIVYDIIEQMGDSKEAIDYYSTTIDLSWLGDNHPSPVRKTLLISADRDLLTSEIGKLQQTYQAVAGDWESGAIAHIAKLNKVKLLILRGVSDLVSSEGGEAYGNEQVFINGTETVMKKLIEILPLWLEKL